MMIKKTTIQVSWRTLIRINTRANLMSLEQGKKVTQEKVIEKFLDKIEAEEIEEAKKIAWREN